MLILVVDIKQGPIYVTCYHYCYSDKTGKDLEIQVMFSYWDFRGEKKVGSTKVVQNPDVIYEA